MKKDFLPYELALKLKAIDFNEPCLATIDQTNYIHIKGTRRPIRGTMLYNTIDCPTFSQAFRWFREKYALQGYVYSTTVRGGKEGKHFSDYCWHINGIDMPFLSTDARDMENVSYEEAELACLQKLIEIVESKSK